MRISIPNLIPTLGYLMLLTISVLMAVAFVQTYGQDGIGMTIFFLIFECVCLGMIVILSLRFKLIAVSFSELIIIYPFRFRITRIRIKDLNVRCELLEAPLWANFQKIMLNDSSQKVSFTDFEFINFNKLIKRIPLNQAELNAIRIKVAKNNRILNSILIPVFSISLFMAISQLRFGVTHLIPKINLVLSSIILYRLVTSLFLYFKWIKSFRA